MNAAMPKTVVKARSNTEAGCGVVGTDQGSAIVGAV